MGRKQGFGVLGAGSRWLRGVGQAAHCSRGVAAQPVPASPVYRLSRRCKRRHLPICRLQFGAVPAPAHAAPPMLTSLLPLLHAPRLLSRSCPSGWSRRKARQQYGETCEGYGRSSTAACSGCKVRVFGAAAAAAEVAAARCGAQSSLLAVALLSAHGSAGATCLHAGGEPVGACMEVREAQPNLAAMGMRCVVVGRMCGWRTGDACCSARQSPELAGLGVQQACTLAQPFPWKLYDLSSALHPHAATCGCSRCTCWSL